MNSSRPSRAGETARRGRLLPHTLKDLGRPADVKERRKFMIEPILTRAARRHIRYMARAIVPLASRLDRRFRMILKERQSQAAQTRCLLAITASTLR